MPRSKEGIKRPSVPVGQLKIAVNAVKSGNLKVREAAREYGVSRTTLQRHLDRCHENESEEFQYVNKCNHKQVFTSDEEASLSEYLIEASKIHYGLSRRDTCVLAYEFAKLNKKTYPSSWDTKGKAGKQWYGYFMRRHRNVLALRKPEPTSMARATAFNKHTVSTFFRKYKDVMDKYHFPAHTIYNMDESGLSTVHKPTKIVAERGRKQVGSVTSGEKGPTVTIVGCVSATGYAIPPLLIFPRVHVQKYMVMGAPPDTICATNPSGWINSEIFIAFMHHFIKHTKPSREKPVLLILDNHETHLSIEAITLAKEKGVVMLTIPPHTSHKLQPLDRSVYGPLKTYFNSACCDWIRTNAGSQITIQHIASLVGRAFPQAFTPLNITAGFRVTGIWPINENIFTDDEFLSSFVTDRPVLAEHKSAEEPTVTPAVNEQSKQTKDEVMVTEKVVIEPSTSATRLSPYQVRPLPKAIPRKTSNRGRKPGRCRVLTDTPEKAEIQAISEAKLAKSRAAERGKIPVLKFSDSSNDHEKTYTLIESSEEESAENSPDHVVDLNEGEFCISKLEGKRNHFYVTEILSASAVHYMVNYYCKLPKTGSFIKKDNEPYLISPQDVVCKLPDPKVVGTSARRQLQFYSGLVKKYNVE